MFSVRRPELWRTTTARLTLLYGLVFAAGVVALLGLIYWSAAGYLTHQMDLIVTGQARALQSVAAPRLAGDDQVHLMGQIAGRAPVDQPEQGDHAGGEHRAIDQRQAGGGGAPELRPSH